MWFAQTHARPIRIRRPCVWPPTRVTACRSGGRQVGVRSGRLVRVLVGARSGRLVGVLVGVLVGARSGRLVRVLVGVLVGARSGRLVGVQHVAVRLQPMSPQLVVVAERRAARVAHVALLAGVPRPVATQTLHVPEALSAELAAEAADVGLGRALAPAPAAPAAPAAAAAAAAAVAEPVGGREAGGTRRHLQVQSIVSVRAPQHRLRHTSVSSVIPLHRHIPAPPPHDHVLRRRSNTRPHQLQQLITACTCGYN